MHNLYLSSIVHDATIKQKRKAMIKALAYWGTEGSLSLLEEGSGPLPPAFLFMTFLATLHLGCLLSFSSERSSGLMSQKEAPRSLMVEGEMARGVEEQPTQFLSLQADDLKPLWTFLSLTLLLRSASERMVCFCLLTFYFFASVAGVRADSCSASRSSRFSKMTEEVGWKRGQVCKVTEGQDEGRKKMLELPYLLLLKNCQASDSRNSLAQLNVGLYKRRKMKKDNQWSGIEIGEEELELEKNFT